MRVISSIILILVLVLGVGLYLFTNRSVPEVAVTNFEDCVAAGNPVMESYPRQCRDENGTLHIEDTPSAPGAPTMEPPTDTSTTPDTDTQATTVEVSGTITDINLEQMAIDGPARITIATSANEEVLITVPSMGLPLCEASANIADVATLEVGQTVKVRGSADAAGDITPCESADDYLRLE